MARAIQRPKRKKSNIEKLIRKRMTYMKRRNLPNFIRAPSYHRFRQQREHGVYSPILKRYTRFGVKTKGDYAARIQGLVRGRQIRNDLRAERTNLVELAAFRRGIPHQVRNHFREYAGVPAIIPGQFGNLGMSRGGRGYIGRARGTGLRGGMGNIRAANPDGVGFGDRLPPRRNQTRTPAQNRANNEMAVRIRSNAGHGPYLRKWI